jgi:hypothetical protein
VKRLDRLERHIIRVDDTHGDHYLTLTRQVAELTQIVVAQGGQLIAQQRALQTLRADLDTLAYEVQRLGNVERARMGGDADAS